MHPRGPEPSTWIVRGFFVSPRAQNQTIFATSGCVPADSSRWLRSIRCCQLSPLVTSQSGSNQWSGSAACGRTCTCCRMEPPGARQRKRPGYSAPFHFFSSLMKIRRQSLQDLITRCVKTRQEIHFGEMERWRAGKKWLGNCWWRRIARVHKLGSVRQERSGARLPLCVINSLYQILRGMFINQNTTFALIWKLLVDAWVKYKVQAASYYHYRAQRHH